jgi:hypothetical protein
MTGTSLSDAYIEWTEHRFFRYRGCAPDADNPRRASGNPELSLDAWLGEDRDGGERQKEREAREEAAKEVCLNCPVMVECDVYANSVTADGKLVEPRGIRGGRTASERKKVLAKARQAPRPVRAAPDWQFHTQQKQDVLRALAVCWEPVEVAVRAEMPDVRTANWQRSDLVRLLGLPKDASRMTVLATAQGRGLLEGVEVVADDGSVPAVPPATGDLLIAVKGQKLLWPSKRKEVLVGGPVRRVPGRGVRAVSLRRKFTAVAGQDELPVETPVVEPVELADVRALFPAELLGAAA